MFTMNLTTVLVIIKNQRKIEWIKSAKSAVLDLYIKRIISAISHEMTSLPLKMWFSAQGQILVGSRMERPH